MSAKFKFPFFSAGKLNDITVSHEGPEWLKYKKKEQMVHKILKISEQIG